MKPYPSQRFDGPGPRAEDRRFGDPPNDSDSRGRALGAGSHWERGIGVTYHELDYPTSGMGTASGSGEWDGTSLHGK